ncbi:MAG: hypothetical protein II776_05225, partial [Clostridia bacterium]|nr:hypothetical protein [Clostridia bacterium]
FLKKTLQNGRNGKLYVLAKTEGYGLEMPAVVFTKTDLTGADTIEEAARRVRGNGRITVQYQAQIHGDEPASGEGAMGIAAALAGARGDRYLDKMNVVVIPRVNPDGARAYTRKEVAKKVNLNRDFILCECVETRAVQKVFRAFRPEIFTDGHEYTKKPTFKTAPFDDLMLGVAAGINNGKEINDLSLVLLKKAFADAQKEGFRVTTYSDAQYETKLCIANAANPSTGRLYYGLLGSLTILIESRGNTAGKEAYLRRVAGHITTVLSILDFACERADEIRRTVRGEREAIREAGKAYDPRRKFVLTTDIEKNEETALTLARPVYSLETGACIQPDKTNKLYFYDLALRTRPLPTAYVLPLGLPREKELLDVIEQNGIRCGRLPAGASLPLRQYVGSAERAFLDEEKETVFPKGALVLPMSQEAGLLLATLLEPDCTDVSEGRGSLAQSGIISPVAGIFPIYRSEKELPAALQ